MTVRSVRTCWRCKGDGFVRQPCPICGRLKVPDGTAQMAGTLFSDIPAVRKPTKKAGNH